MQGTARALRDRKCFVKPVLTLSLGGLAQSGVKGRGLSNLGSPVVGEGCFASGAIYGVCSAVQECGCRVPNTSWCGLHDVPRILHPPVRRPRLSRCGAMADVLRSLGEGEQAAARLRRRHKGITAVKPWGFTWCVNARSDRHS